MLVPLNIKYGRKFRLFVTNRSSDVCVTGDIVTNTAGV